MTSQRWQPGEVLDGFTLGELVHTGGMGAIFRVAKPGLTFPAVMKLPQLGVPQAGEAIVAFQTEVMIAPTLQGPHVPKFIAAGDLAPIFDWLEANIWSQASQLETSDLITRATGAPLSADHFERHLRSRYLGVRST